MHGDDGSGGRHDGRGGGMAARGVSRPMAEQRAGVLGPEEQEEQGGHGDGDHGPPYGKARYRMLAQHHRQTSWVYWTLLLLGFWTALAPLNFGYLNESSWVDPSGGRGVWFSSSTHTELRAWLMTWSDVASGLLLVGLAWRSLRAAAAC